MLNLIASDIHGSKGSAQKILELDNKYNFKNIYLLGDINYNGARNVPPFDYSPIDVCKILGNLVSKITFICGNCDSRVDAFVFKKEFKDDNYTINTYLKEAGFYTNDEKLFDTTAGLYYGDLYHNRCGFCNHDTETSIAYIDQKGNKVRKDVYKVSVYHNWIGVATDVRVDNLDKNYYFVFIKDNQTELAGRYKDTYFNNVMEGKLTKLFPTVIEHNANQCYVKAEVKKGY